MQRLKIIKIGGNIINDDKTLQKFITDFTKLNCPKILVHGGGNLASDLAEQLGIKVNKIDGRRITDQATLDVITMVYAGKISKSIVANLQAKNCNAIGLSGADGNAILSIKRSLNPIDFGYVGDVLKVSTAFVELLLREGIVPVFCAITHDKKGQLLNTNADTIASELAMALANIYQTELYYCFEKKGVLTDVLDENSVIKKLDFSIYKNLKEKGKIADGMIPKLDNSFKALHQKVSKVCIGQPEMIFNSSSICTILKL
jgi:acetylglutamate kinase